MSTVTKHEDHYADERGNTSYFEKWAQVQDYEGLYEVSSLGRVRSVTRINVNRNGVQRTLVGKVMKLSSDGEGYSQVSLLRDGKETKVRVHRIVARAFIINPLGLPIVDHNDRSRTHNSVGNLRWATYSQNRANSSQRASEVQP